MHVPDVQLHEATTLEEAAAAMRRHAPDARLLAGGTDLLVDLKTGRVSFGHLVSINRIDALRGISETADGLRIGALTTITQLDRSPVVQQRFAPLLAATGQMANPQIRNVATVGGNIASAVPCADLPPILTAMGASVVLWSAVSRREVPLEAFFVGPRQTVRRDDEVLTAVLVPQPPPSFGAAYTRFQLRDGNAIAVAAVAASIRLGDDATVQNARVVLGAVAPIPKLVESAIQAVIGHKLDENSIHRAAVAAMEAAEPISDVRGTADFRRELVGVLTRRALETARQRAARWFPITHPVNPAEKAGIGVYRVRATDSSGSPKPIRRPRAIDKEGILYIGQGNLRKRVGELLDRKGHEGRHHFLKTFVDRALDQICPRESLQVQWYEVQMPEDEERRLIGDYETVFGDLPPGNLKAGG